MRRAGWWGDALYGRVDSICRDGLGVTHFTVKNTCDRCGEEYIMARFSEKVEQ